MIYSPGDILVREIGGGVWFFVSATLAVAFVGYVVHERCRYRSAFWSPVCKAAVALALFCSGSALRAFLTWGQFFYLAHDLNPQPWIRTWPWFGSSVILNILGGAYCIWVLSPERWRWTATTLTLSVAIVVPAALAYLL